MRRPVSWLVGGLIVILLQLLLDFCGDFELNVLATIPSRGFRSFSHSMHVCHVCAVPVLQEVEN